jgi:hypothetical protein
MNSPTNSADEATKTEKASERYLTATDAIKDSLGQSLQRWQDEAKALDIKIGKR